MKVLLPAKREFEGPWTERASTERASRQQLAPAVVPTTFSPETVLVTDWLDGAQATEEQGRAGPHRREVAELLRRTHGLKELREDLPPSTRLMGAAEERVRQLRELKLELPVSVDMLGKRVAWLKAQLYAAQGPQAFCHQDVVPRNIMLTSAGPIAVDWDWAAYGDPLRDLTMWAAHCDMSPDETNEFLDEYLGRAASPEQRRRLHLLVAAVDADYYGCELVYHFAGTKSVRMLEARVLRSNPFLPSMPAVRTSAQ